MVKTPDTSPQSMPQVTPRASEMPAYSAQILFEMNHTLGRIEGTLNSLSKQVDAIEGRVATVEKHWNWIAGAVAIAVFLVPACAYAIWWAVSDKIEAVLKLIQQG